MAQDTQARLHSKCRHDSTRSGKSLISSIRPMGAVRRSVYKCVRVLLLTFPGDTQENWRQPHWCG